MRGWFAMIAISATSACGPPGYLPANVIVDGDSIAHGAGVSSPNTWAEVLGSKLLRHGNVTNVGVDGADLATVLIPGAWTRVDALFATDRRNIVVVLAGTNDLANGATAAEAYVSLAEYCGDRRAVGWRVAVCTVLPRGPVFEESVRLDYNDAVRTNWSTFADALVDIGGDTLIGQTGQNTNLTYYQADHGHPNAAGDAVIAGLVFPKVEGLL